MGDDLKWMFTKMVILPVVDAVVVGRQIGRWEMMLRETMERDYPDMDEEDMQMMHFMLGTFLGDYVVEERSKTTLVKFPDEKNIAKVLAEVCKIFEISDKAEQIWNSLIKRNEEIKLKPHCCTSSMEKAE
ncbi:MAG: hypothetical protein LBF34_01260 [Puniceicoccales bacterium]|jgi:c-di-GMP-related signal transduction protein|nr:hypothetical protein [Puniceicoccales bacterium]